MKKKIEKKVMKAHLLNYQTRNEVYEVPCWNKVKDFPDLRHFTEGNKYPVINELITDEIPGPGHGQYKHGGLSYLTRNDEGDMVCVPHIYFNLEPMLLGEYLEDNWQENAWILSHSVMPDLANIRTLLSWYEKQIDDLKEAKLIAENIKKAFLDKLEVIQKDIVDILNDVTDNKETAVFKKLGNATEKMNEVILEEKTK